MTTLSYNGFSAFDAVDVREIVAIPDVGPNKASRGSTRHRASGTAVVRVTDKMTTPIGTQIKNLSAKLNKQAAALLIQVTDLSGTFDVVNVESDDRTGPYPEVVIHHVNGSNSLTVAWAFEWFSIDAAAGGTAPNALIEFQMGATFDIDDMGRTTITKTGYIVIRKSGGVVTMPPPAFPAAPAEGARTAAIGYNASKSNADVVLDYFNPTGFNYPEQYRRLVAGNCLRGFQRVAQKYMTDESRVRMAFLIIDKEEFRGNPNPVRRSNVERGYQQAMPGVSGDAQMIGLKTFTARLEGPGWIKQTSVESPYTAVPTLGSSTAVTPADLLLVAIRMSQNFIVWGKSSAAEADLIMSIEVRELDILRKNEIEFTVVAKATANANYASGQSQPYRHSLWLGDILQTITITGAAATGGATGAIALSFTATTSPDAYGDFGIFRVTPSFYDAQQAVGSQAWETTDVIAAGDKTNAVYILPDAVFSNVIEASSKKVHAGLDTRTNKKNSLAAGAGGTNPKPYTSFNVTRRYVVPDTGVVVIPSQSLAGADLVVQTQKPCAFVHEVTVATRMNARVEEDFAALETGAAVMFQDFAEGGGKQDANGNRLFVGRHVRIYRVRDPGGSGGNNFFNQGGIRQWGPAATALAGTENKPPELASSATRTAAVAGDATFELDLGTPDAWV